MLIVAMLSYLFSLQINADEQRCVNNYFTGLLHDLPEVLTRDIINPVKRSVPGLDDLIKEYEAEEMERKIYKLMPSHWREDIKMFTQHEFTDICDSDGRLKRDGILVKAVDDLSAFIEAYLSLNNGIRSEPMEIAKHSLKEAYKFKNISGIDFGELYADFD
jgi:putative hydrolase of HD superfamily